MVQFNFFFFDINNVNQMIMNIMMNLLIIDISIYLHMNMMNSKLTVNTCLDHFDDDDDEKCPSS